MSTFRGFPLSSQEKNNGNGFVDGEKLTDLDTVVPTPSRGRYRKKPIPSALKVKVQKRDGWRCLSCGAEDDLCVDHIFPERWGGKAELGNLQTLCRTCNCKKGVRR